MALNTQATVARESSGCYGSVSLDNSHLAHNIRTAWHQSEQKVHWSIHRQVLEYSRTPCLRLSSLDTYSVQQWLLYHTMYYDNTSGSLLLLALSEAFCHTHGFLLMRTGIMATCLVWLLPECHCSSADNCVEQGQKASEPAWLVSNIRGAT